MISIGSRRAANDGLALALRCRHLVRASCKDAGCDLCGRSNGVLQVSRTKPGAQFEALMAETEHGHRLSAELDGYEFKRCFVGHDPFPFVRGSCCWVIEYPESPRERGCRNVQVSSITTISEAIR